MKIITYLIPSTLAYLCCLIPLTAILLTFLCFTIKRRTFICSQCDTTFLIFSKETASICSIALFLVCNTAAIDAWLHRRGVCNALSRTGAWS